MMRRFLDALVRGASRIALGVFYRQVEITGLEDVPREGPVLFVANHFNALVDPVILLGALPRVPRFLAKSTLWRNPLVAPLLALAGSIPVYRRQDAARGVDTAKNLETFARCHELLARGGAVALFPEGQSHSEPGLVELKTGAARIVLEAEAKFPGLEIKIVPVGLTFEAKGEFRSRLLVAVGEPIDTAPERALRASDAVAAVRALTARVDTGLRAVTLNYPSWEEAALVAHAADLFGRRELAMPRPRRLAEELTLHQRIVEGFRSMKECDPERAAAVEEAVGDYGRLLALARVTDEQVASRYPLPTAARWLWRTLAFLLGVSPLAAVGILIHWLPYRMAGWIAWLVARHEEDERATYKLFPSLVLFPTVWIAVGVLVAREWGTGAGWVAGLVAAPLLGWIALKFNDRRVSLLREARAYWVLRTHDRLSEELRRRRAEAAAAVESLAAVYQERSRDAAHRSSSASRSTP